MSGSTRYKVYFTPFGVLFPSLPLPENTTMVRILFYPALLSVLSFAHGAAWTGHPQNNATDNTMEHTDFTLTFRLDQSPETVFNAINDVRSWWSADFSGSSQQLNDVFEVRFADVHYSRQQLTEVVPGKTVVWLVTESRLNFLQDKSEWTGTTIRFDISEKDGKTELRFTHTGLVPGIECYGDCTNGWTQFLEHSLIPRITTGKGNLDVLNGAIEEKTESADFTTGFSVDRSPEEVFAAVVHPRGWWSEEITGGTAQLNDEFDYHYQDVHTCRMRLTEVVPGKKVTWLVLSNNFNFTQDKTEWVGTTITFDIFKENGQTQLRFTHHGLVPAYECYDVCFGAWSNYINVSLRNLILTGEGLPNPKETE